MENKNWTTDKLENLCDIVLGRTPSRSKKEFWGKGTDWVSISDMKKKLITSTKEQITDIGAAKSRSRLIQKGTLLMSFKLSIGKLAFAGKDLYTNEAIASLPIKNTKILDKEYLYYLLQNIPLIGGNQAVMGKTLNKSSLQNLQIPYPKSIDDQKRIAKVLCECEDLIAKRKESIALLDDLVKSTFLEMFGDPVENEKRWDTNTITQLVTDNKYSIKRGPFGGSLKKSIFVEKGHLVYEQFHALNNDFTFKRYFIDDKKFEELKAFRVGPGDIIISCSGVYLGKLAVLPDNAEVGVINQALLKVSLDQTKIKNEFFINLFTNDHFKSKYFGKTRGSGVPNFPPMTSFKKFKFIKPPIELQEKYISILKNIEKLKKLYELHLNELYDLFSRLSQDAFKGTLDLSKVIIIENDEVSSTQTTQDVINETDYKSLFSIRNIDTYLENKIKNNFRDKDFVFDDIKELLIADYSASYNQYDYDKWKNNFFEILRNKNTYLTQFFDKDQGTVKFKISDEVN